MVQTSAESVQPQHQSQAVEECDTAKADELAHARQVGREFVYIYYMCVNKCPRDLYRFYSAASFFVHGGRELPGQTADPPISGQAAIATKIGTLEFRDCRTKILMVDSLPAPANGVLIQVCGEISNNAGPMRRFMQTFLLSPNGPNKYFVQNGIFRYQDEVFTDSDGVAAACDDDAVVATDGAVNTGDNGCEAAATAQPDNYAADVENGCDDAVANGDDCDAGVDESAACAEINEDQAAGETTTAAEARETANDSETEGVADCGDGDVAAAEAVASQQQPQPPPPVVASSAAPTSSAGGSKKNFAALFGSSGGQQPPQPAPPPARRPPPPAAQTNGNHDAAAPPLAASSSNAERRERVAEAPDHLQVFVGNLAPEVRDTDLAELFRQFGEVTACRITNGKARVGNGVPMACFGFVSFASADSVKAAVSNPPTMNGGRINVEEKKPGYRRAPGGGGRGGGGYGGGGYGGSYGGGRGGYADGQQPRR